MGARPESNSKKWGFVPRPTKIAPMSKTVPCMHLKSLPPHSCWLKNSPPLHFLSARKSPLLQFGRRNVNGRLTYPIKVERVVCVPRTQRPSRHEEIIEIVRHRQNGLGVSRSTGTFVEIVEVVRDVVSKSDKLFHVSAMSTSQRSRFATKRHQCNDHLQHKAIQ